MAVGLHDERYVQQWRDGQASAQRQPIPDCRRVASASTCQYGMNANDRNGAAFGWSAVVARSTGPAPEAQVVEAAVIANPPSPPRDVPDVDRSPCRRSAGPPRRRRPSLSAHRTKLVQAALMLGVDFTTKSSMRAGLPSQIPAPASNLLLLRPLLPEPPSAGRESRRVDEPYSTSTWEMRGIGVWMGSPTRRVRAISDGRLSQPASRYPPTVRADVAAARNPSDREPGASCCARPPTGTGFGSARDPWVHDKGHKPDPGNDAVPNGEARPAMGLRPAGRFHQAGPGEPAARARRRLHRMTGGVARSMVLSLPLRTPFEPRPARRRLSRPAPRKAILRREPGTGATAARLARRVSSFEPTEIRSVVSG